MAITGALPPNSGSGKAFIFDPQLIEDWKVKAAIKLKFRAINRKPMLAIRGFEITKKSTQVEFQRKEQYIKVKNDKNEEEAINYSLGEMDHQVSELLGVSKVVLENVILTHQEDSLWPFYNTFALRRIFDDLFSTSKLSKMIGQLQAMYKDYEKRMKAQKVKMEMSGKDLDSWMENLVDYDKYLDWLTMVKADLFQKETLKQDLTKDSGPADPLDSLQENFESIFEFLEKEKEEFFY